MTLIRTDRPGTRHARRRECLRLAEQDRCSAQLASLRQTCEVLAGARDLVDTGWIRGGWFAYETDGVRQVVGAQNLALVQHRPVTAACLVGALVYGGGGVAAVDSEPVRRAIELTWSALTGDHHRPINWCPPRQSERCMSATSPAGTITNRDSLPTSRAC
jgi:hypothetical protein